MGKSHRTERLGEEIRKVVSEMLIRGDLKDPRFKGMIGVSGVDVSGDGSYATLYITTLSFNPGQEITADEKQYDGTTAATINTTNMHVIAREVNK